MAFTQERQNPAGCSPKTHLPRRAAAPVSELKKHAMVLLVSLTFLLSLNFVSGASLHATFTDEEAMAIEDFASEILTCFEWPGLGLGIVKGDYTFATNLGLADWNTGLGAGPNTLFNLGSTSKALVPYVMAEIMNGDGNQDGRIRWDTKLKELLKNELDIEVNAPWAEQTLREVLVYSASDTPPTSPFPLSSAADMSTMAGLPKDVTRDEIIRRAAHFMPDTPEFRSSGHYSNLMYTIVARLAEKLAGKPWEQLVKDEVLDKNNMRDTHFTPAALNLEDAALPVFEYQVDQDLYMPQNNSLFDLHPFEPVGSIMATASDVTKWLRHLLHNLYLDGRDSELNVLIGDAFVRSATAPDQQKLNDHKKLLHDSEVTMGHGMGWQVSEYKGRKRYEYAGHLYSYTSRIWLFPDTRTAVFVVASGPVLAATDAMMNHVMLSLALNGILYHTSDVLHGEKPWTNHSEVCRIAGFDDDDDDMEILDDNFDTMSDEPVQDDVDYPLPPDTYTGSYGHGLVGDLIVEVDNNGLLTVRLGRNLRGKLKPKQGTTTKLLLKAVGSLQNTYEWAAEKELEFLPLSVSAAGNGEKFQIIRLYLTDKLYYDFQRGKMFGTMLAEAEEEEIKKAKEEEQRKIREEKEAQMREEAARKAIEEEEMRRQEELAKKQMLEAVAREEAKEKARKEAEQKEMLAAVAREEAAEKARKEAEQKEMLAAVAREKDEEERRTKEGEIKYTTQEGTQAQAAALEKTEDDKEDVATSHSKANLVKQDDDYKSHQSHQPYSEGKDETGAEVLPPEKVTDIGSGKSRSGNDGDKDGAHQSPNDSTGLVLVMTVLVVFVQTIFHRN